MDAQPSTHAVEPQSPALDLAPSTITSWYPKGILDEQLVTLHVDRAHLRHAKRASGSLSGLWSEGAKASVGGSAASKFYRAFLWNQTMPE